MHVEVLSLRREYLNNILFDHRFSQLIRDFSLEFLIRFSPRHSKFSSFHSFEGENNEILV